MTALLPIALAAPATASPCLPSFKEMVCHLASRYHEQAIVEATAGGKALHVFRSSAGTCSVVVLMPQGFSCVVAAGQDWEFLRPSPDAAALRARPAAARLPD